METRRWTNPSLPQTLQIAVFLFYFHAFFDVLYTLSGSLGLLGVVLIAGQVGAGYGIANEKRWGYKLGIAMAFSPFILRLIFLGASYALGFSIISLAFEVALVALLLHPQSKDYQRIWFR
jgi:hypothetical protein